MMGEESKPDKTDEEKGEGRRFRYVYGNKVATINPIKSSGSV